MLYPINEIFHSVQGEGYHTGKAAIFIRLAGCNLQCSWCDTDHSCKERMTPEQIFQRVIDLGWCKDVIFVITGGEPTMYNLRPLVEMIWAYFTGVEETPFICLETNGTAKEDSTLPLLYLHDRIAWTTVSPKVNVEIAPWMMGEADEIKVVYDGVNEPDKYYDNNMAGMGRLFIQPCSEDYESAYHYVLSNPGWRLSVQTQKVLKVK